jgi:hypothetical protein
MGDPRGPWQEYGGGPRRGPDAPPPSPPPVLPSRWRAPPFLQPPPPPAPGPAPQRRPGEDTAQGDAHDAYADDADDRDHGEDGYGDVADDTYDEDTHGDQLQRGAPSGIAADYGYGRPGDHLAPATGLAGLAASVRAGASEAAWRYRSAPLWARITADVVAGALVLALVVGVSLLVRADDAPQQASTREPLGIQTVPTTSTTVATTTTSTTTTTTTPPTTTTVPPTTVTTSAPVVPPPSEPPAPPTTEEVRYRDCFEAWLAGALPLRRGDPGYGPHLDRDGDGEACEFREGGGGGGDPDRG